MKTKITAVLTAACFIASSVFGQIIYAGYNHDSAAEIIKSSDSFIPFSAGKVTYAKNFNSKDIVINIQDLHCHGETQKNIAAILKALEKYGFDKIYLEGAVSDVSTDKFINFRTSELGKLVVEDLLVNGTLSGAEYYSIKSGKADIIKALDKSDLYFENILLLGNIFNNREEINAELKGLKNDIQSVKKEYYNSDLLRLDKFNGDFSKGKISAKKYYSILSKLSSKAGININAYANVHKYISLINEKGIDYGKITDELRIFINVLKEILPYGIYHELSAKSNDFSNTEDLFPVFAALSDSYGICKQYKLNNLATFFKYLKTNGDLNLLNFAAEEDRLIHDIGISLSRTGYERDVVFLNRFIKVLDVFFNTKITSGDYAYYLNNRKKFDETVSKYLGKNIHLANLKEKLSDYEKYHSNNIKRDDVFLSLLSCSNETAGTEYSDSNNFTDLKALMDYASEGANIKIAITGGFHSEGLKKRLLENKTSFIIITPNVTGNTEKAENLYFSVISQYTQVFTSALKQMPVLSEPIQIALPKIIESTINRAAINNIPLREIEGLINGIVVSAEKDSEANSAAERLLYKPVKSAEVTINSVTGNTVEFTVMYDYYGYGKHPAYYIYDFKTKSVSLTVDSAPHAMPESGNAGGFIGKFSAPVVYTAGTNASNPAVAELSVSLISDAGLSEMEIGGRFIDGIGMRERIKSVLNNLSEQNTNKDFQSAIRTLLEAAGSKAAERIKFFEIETAYAESGGYRENKTAEIGGFSSNKFNIKHEGIIALRKDLFSNDTALFHEFVHWALAEGAIKVKDIESAVTDPEKRERFIKKEPFDEHKETGLSGIFKNEYNDSKRGHNAIRAFQAQYLPGADTELTLLIRASSKDYRDASIQENEAAKNNIVRKFESLLSTLAAKKEGEKTAAASADEDTWFDEEPDTAAGMSGEPAKTAEPIIIDDQLSVSGSAQLHNNTTLVLDKAVLNSLAYTPGSKVYITSLPEYFVRGIASFFGGHVFLFTQPEALKSFADSRYEELGYKANPFSFMLIPFHLRMLVYLNTMDGIIDKNGVLKISRQANAFDGETAFFVRGSEHGVVRILPSTYVKELLEENDPTEQLSEEYARGIEESIRAAESSASFMHDRINTAFRFLNEDRKHITPALKPVLERMLKDEGLNRDQKAFTVLLLAAISAAENPDIDYVMEQIKNAGAINADSLILWLKIINNPRSEDFFSQIISHLQSKAVVSVYGETMKNALGSLTVLERMKNALSISENELWLLETERAESPGGHMLYGKIFVDAAMSDSNIDSDRLAKLKDFGVKPLALRIGKKGVANDRNRLCYVNVDMNGAAVTAEAYLRMENNIPVIAMVPLKFETKMNPKEFYVKASEEVLNRLQNDYVVKGKFAYLTSGISLLERAINFISNESLFRMIGKEYDFDLKAFAFDGKNMSEFAGAVTKIFPDALDIRKSAEAAGRNDGKLNYYDISGNKNKTRTFMLEVLKRLVLKDKESKSRSGIIVGEKISSKLFSLISASEAPLSSYGVNGLSSYFENRMRQSVSSIMLLEDAVMSDNPAIADIALIDWASAAQMAAGVKISESEINIYGGDIEDVRAKSLAISEKAFNEISAEVKSDFEKFVNANRHLKDNDISPAEQFAQFILTSQISKNLKEIHKNGGKVVLSLNISGKMKRDDIIQAALFWQSVGFDGIRMNFASEKMINNNSLFIAVSAQMRKVKSDSIIMAGLPSSLLSAVAVREFVENASNLDIITALSVANLNENLEEFKQKIWADINPSDENSSDANPLDEEYKSDAEKYFADIQKAVAFGAGYIGVSAGTNIISADGKSVHVEIMSKITEILSLPRTLSPYEAYAEGYKTGLQSKDELKTGTDTNKLLVQELIKLQNGKSLRQGIKIDEEAAKHFVGFLEAEPGIKKLRFIQDSLAGNNKNGIYAAAGYLRGAIEASLLSSFRKDNGLSDTQQSELLRTLLFLDLSMPQDAKASGEKEPAVHTAAKLSGMTPDEMLQTMLEEEYGGQAAKSFTDYALYIYTLQNNGATINEIIKNVELLMRAHLSEINFGYGIPVNGNLQSADDEKSALEEIIKILALAEHKPASEFIKDAVNVSVNKLAVSMMLKSA